MKMKSIITLTLLSLTASAPAPKLGVALTADYVEARTASVFCGACHYNGELVTQGREALLAWNITGGSWKNVDLTGITAVAEITCDANLSDPQANRTCEIVISSAASETQAAAMTDLITTTAGPKLGRILPTHRASISFKHEGGEYDVTADGFADLSVQALPNDECCTQPHMVWYQPMAKLAHRKVGYTQSADYLAGTNGDTWGREDQNSAFYGSVDFSGAAANK